jgi:S1-C subfamily serine protease
MRVVSRFNGRVLLVLALLGGLAAAVSPVRGEGAAADPGAAVVKVYVAAVEPLVFAPWRPGYSTARTGSGAVIAEGLVLTNAHVVEGQTFVQVRPNGSPDKYPAQVAFVSHLADLALLQVDDAAFQAQVAALPLGELPSVQDAVAAFGFPNGGETLSITAGVVSRVEHESYVHSREELLSIQMDAAIAPGSSGGPLVAGGKLVGIAMQSWGESTIGCAIPVPVVRQFLEDVLDGRYDGIPKLGVETQTLENPALKASLAVPPGETGVVVNALDPDSPFVGTLEAGDILLALDGVDIADDGTVEFRPRERTSLSYVPDRRQVGDSLGVRLARGSEIREARVTLSRSRGQGDLMPWLHDRSADYYIYGGLAFVALSMDHVSSMQSYRALPPAVAVQLTRRPESAGDEVVYLADVLTGEVNRGYESTRGAVIHTVDGQPVRNLPELVQVVEEGHGTFVTFGYGQGRRITLRRDEAAAANPGLLERYGVTADRSATLAREREVRLAAGGRGDDPPEVTPPAAPPAPMATAAPPARR